VTFAREGMAFIVLAAALAGGGYALALGRRSWMLWLVAFVAIFYGHWTFVR